MLKNIIVLALCFMAYIIGNIDALSESQRKSQFDRLVKCYGQMFENGLIKPIPELYKSDTDTFQTIMTTFYELYEIKTINDKNDDIVPSVNNKKRKLDTITHSDDTPGTSVKNNENNITKINHSDGTPEISVDNEKHKLKTIEHSDDAPETSVNNKKPKLNTIIHSDDAPEVSVDINDFVQNENQEEFKAQIDALTNKIKMRELKEYPLNAFVLRYLPNNDKEYLRTTSAFCKHYSIKSFL